MRRHARVALAALTAAAAVMPGCDRLPGRPTEAERYVAPDSVRDVSVLFGDNCSGCHGEPGRRGPVRNLGDPLFLAVIGKSEMRRVISEGVQGTSMPAFSQAEGGWLTDPQIDTLVDGLFARWSAPAVFTGVQLPAYSEMAARKAGVAPGDASRGLSVWTSYCASCHGARGEGGSGGAIVDASFLALVSDQGLRSSVIAGRPELHMPAFQGYEGRPPLSFQQISDVTAWMVAQRRAFPGQPYAQDGGAAAPAQEP
jgi:cytochrome c oxidase cbb3-type subunit 3/ubiquinol-cytochrome c reductase cytochrome c subunit